MVQGCFAHDGEFTKATFQLSMPLHTKEPSTKKIKSVPMFIESLKFDSMRPLGFS